MAGRREGSKTELITAVDAGLFGDPRASAELLRRSVLVENQRRRQGTSSTKTRGEVVGSTAKLYGQKGTGRARAGSMSATQRRGGSVVFGPRPRDVRRRISRRERREALRSLLASMARDERIHCVYSWGDIDKTKERAKWLADTGLVGKVLLLDSAPPDDLQRSSRNIPGVTVQRADAVGFMDIAVADHVVASEDALKVLQGTRNG